MISQKQVSDAGLTRVVPAGRSATALNRRGEKKAEMTVRHHVNVLKGANMVEIARLEDEDGGARKYYRSTTRTFSYDLPEKLDWRHIGPVVDE